jgi:hypothetical protein
MARVEALPVQRGDSALASIAVPTPASLKLRQSTDAVRRRARPLDGIPPADRTLAEAYSYWSRVRPGGLLPARRDINIAEFCPLVGAMHLVDASSATAEDYRFRVYGSKAPTETAPDFGAQRLGDVKSEIYRRSVIEDYRTVVLTGVPAYHQIAAKIDLDVHTYSRLILPLADDGRRVTMLIVCTNSRSFDDLAV